MIKSLYPIFQKWASTGSIYIISDTHFEDKNCKLMDPDWITPEMHLDILQKLIHKNDTLLHLGDVGNVKYINQLKGYKVLLTGNHDKISEVQDCFDEIYTGPLFIADRILLSHEPIYGLEGYVLNIHGHDHSGDTYTYIEELKCYSHINLASNVVKYLPFNLGQQIKLGILHNIKNYHRRTIDNATERTSKYENLYDYGSY